MLRACAFVPGHVTGFFEIHDRARDIKQRGSRGVGICLSKGVHTILEVSTSEKQKIEVFINEKGCSAPVTKFTVKKIVGHKPLKVRVLSELELPQGQGFGMSGAGALSVSLALAKALDLDLSINELVCIAHEAEITCGTGLGDVMPQSIGGVVIRKKEGCLPYGIVENIETRDVEIVLCVIGKELSTKDIITDNNHRKRINEHGKECLDWFNRNPNLEEMMRLSHKFSKNTELLSKELEDAIMAANKFGMASMSMLGNSIFAVGDTDGLISELKNFGDVYICSVDRKGMRIAQGEE